ncbi:MAG: cytochrome b/b6 domain-containing protein [Micavibrio sp.]|nr:cytochrome b/b6 domain-containing protein [Micavibrio sp.]
MPVKNTQTQFGSVARALHWSIALLILSLLCVGFYMIGMEFSPLKLQIYSIHKSFGLIVLLLGIARIIWKSINPRPNHLASHTKFERLAAGLMHILLYVGIIVMPLSGWIMSSAGEYPASFFGLFDIPHLTAKNEHLYERMKDIHELSAYAIIAAVGLHYLGAVKHHLIDRNDTLRRMGGNLAIAAIFGLTLLLASLSAGKHLLEEINKEAQPITAPPILQTLKNEGKLNPGWIINHKQSHINFTFTQYGNAVNATFEKWDADITFDPDNLENAHVLVSIDINSIATGSADRDAQAREQEWFATDTYPKAIFESDKSGVAHIKGNTYKMLGSLKIKDVTLPTDFTFTLDFAEENGEKTAYMSGNLSVDRTTYGVGQGEWADGQTIGEHVRIDLKVEATKLNDINN